MLNNPPMKRFTKWRHRHTASLHGQTVAITGSTGGLGQALCRELIALGANLILIDRDKAKQQAHMEALRADAPTASVRGLITDLADMEAVHRVVDALLLDPPDVFIHNAGAYSIPRHTCDTGFDNVFQINFVSPYVMIRRLLPTLEQRHGRVVIVGSIAHNYSRSDMHNVDFANVKAASKVYGNAKRWLMAATSALITQHPSVAFSITHPGISFTGITAHYPPWLFAIIKHPMKGIFMKPANACRSILQGVFDSCREDEWIGPWCLDVWGAPKKKRLFTVSPAERAVIAERADDIYTRSPNR